LPLVTAFNLRHEDPLDAIEDAIRQAMVSVEELAVSENEIDFVPLLAPVGYAETITRINVDLWTGPHRTKDRLQRLAGAIATSFQSCVGAGRRVKVVIRPYDVASSGWIEQ
jgi:hypothetical protein